MSIDYPPPVIEMELLAIDLTTCGRCTGTLDNIERAIDIVRPVLDVLGIQLSVTKRVVESEAQARQYKFVTSPTVRINGRDIAFETLESHCEACTDLSNCDEATDCRVWRYRGEEHAEAPVGLVVEGILREIFGGHSDAVGDTPAYRGVPENLRRFFRSKSSVPPATQACCPPAEQKTCCDSNRKAACCDDSKPEACGCR
jgi:hypothetical protein